MLNNRSGSTEKRHSITYQFYCAVLLFLHACCRGTRDAAVGIIAIHFLEHAVLADDRPHVALIVGDAVMITAVGPVAVTVLNALQSAIPVDVAAAVVPRHQYLSFKRLIWLANDCQSARQAVIVNRLIGGRREAGQVYMKSKFNHCDNALSLNGSCKVIVSFSLKGISFLTFLIFSPQLISSALVPFYFFLKIISWSIVVNFHTPPLKSITLYFSMNFHFLFCSKRNTDVF